MTHESKSIQVNFCPGTERDFYEIGVGTDTKMPLLQCLHWLFICLHSLSFVTFDNILNIFNKQTSMYLYIRY